MCAEKSRNVLLTTRLKLKCRETEKTTRTAVMFQLRVQGTFEEFRALMNAHRISCEKIFGVTPNVLCLQ